MWNSILGYVIIRIEGYGLERALNKMLRCGIPVWNITREGANSMLMQIRVKDFFKLRAIGIRCRVRIISRHGMPFFIARLKCRKLLISGAFLILALLCFISTRVLLVSVEGCEGVPKAVVYRALGEAGMSVGMAKKAVIPIELGNAIRNYDDRIAWAGVRLEGVIMRVQVKEAEPIPELPDLSAPADIVAKKDGIIERITAIRGKASADKGDAVRIGDVLIRGDITREDASERLLVRAHGEAQAAVYYSAVVTEKPYELMMQRNGQSTQYRSLFVAGYCVYESEVPYDAYELEKKDVSLVRGLILPIKLISGEAFELERENVRLDRLEQIAMAVYKAEYEALEKVPKDARILDTQNEIQELEDGSIRVESRIRALEDIGISREIN